MQYRDDVHIHRIVNSYVSKSKENAKCDGVKWLNVISYGFGCTTQVNKYKYNSLKLSRRTLYIVKSCE